ncbi:MAG: RNA polymerase-binding protein DksA [Robiginitomaculum sp.]|nr:MAG: RNA polymerase-binding protein DksA [Robiginitomaculum sp.]
MVKTAKKRTKLPKNYTPKEDEKFMGVRQQEFFRQKLEAWKRDIFNQTKNTIEYLQGENVSHPDAVDTAAANADRQLELRARDRQRKLIAKIDKAIIRIENGTYGYCEETGDPIRLGRLEARPIATLSLEAQEMHESAENARR